MNPNPSSSSNPFSSSSFLVWDEFGRISPNPASLPSRGVFHEEQAQNPAVRPRCAPDGSFQGKGLPGAVLFMDVFPRKQQSLSHPFHPKFSSVFLSFPMDEVVMGLSLVKPGAGSGAPWKNPCAKAESLVESCQDSDKPNSSALYNFLFIQPILQLVLPCLG